MIRLVLRFLGSIEGTHNAYRECTELLLSAARDHRAAVLFATHNEASVLHAVARMRALGLSPQGARI
jgi:hypothetical protein